MSNETYEDAVDVSAVEADLKRERDLLARLLRIRRCAHEEGAWGTPGLDRDIAATQVAIDAARALLAGDGAE